MVLKHPEIPLHNNPAELGARRRVRKRVVSYGPRSEQGAKAFAGCFDHTHSQGWNRPAMVSRAV